MKQLETKSVIIGENTFYIKPFGAFYAAYISGELMALVVPAVTGLLALVPEGKKENGDEKTLADVSIDDALPALSSAFNAIGGEKVESILRKLLINQQNVTVSYKDENGLSQKSQLDFDLANELFCQDIGGMYALAFEVIKANYGGFFEKLPGLFGNLLASTKMKQSGNTEPST